LLYALPLNELFKEQLDPFNLKKKLFVRVTSLLFTLFTISLAANIGSFAITLAQFKLISLGALPLNMALVPLASMIISIGFVSLIASCLHIPWIPTLLNDIAFFGIEIMERLINWSLHIPYFYIERSLKQPLSGMLALTLVFACFIALHATNKLYRKRYYAIPLGILSLLCLLT
jgi:hypothetical protein